MFHLADVSSTKGLLGSSLNLTDVQLASGCFGLTAAGMSSYVCTLSVCIILSDGGTTATFVSGSVRVWPVLSLHPCPLSTLVQLARGAMPLHLPKLKMFGHVVGLCNGVASLV